jgi:hypothetical protein
MKAPKEKLNFLRGFCYCVKIQVKNLRQRRYVSIPVVIFLIMTARYLTRTSLKFQSW